VKICNRAGDLLFSFEGEMPAYALDDLDLRGAASGALIFIGHL
jgi:hypothetical protein